MKRFVFTTCIGILTAYAAVTYLDLRFLLAVMLFIYIIDSAFLADRAHQRISSNLEDLERRMSHLEHAAKSKPTQ
jgi:hypothetical protein